MKARLARSPLLHHHQIERKWVHRDTRLPNGRRGHPVIGPRCPLGSASVAGLPAAIDAILQRLPDASDRLAPEDEQLEPNLAAEIGIARPQPLADVARRRRAPDNHVEIEQKAHAGLGILVGLRQPGDRQTSSFGTKLQQATDLVSRDAPVHHQTRKPVHGRGEFGHAESERRIQPAHVRSHQAPCLFATYK